MKIFDTHAHYDDKQFDSDREYLLKQCVEQGIDTIVNIGASIETSKNTLELIDNYPFMYGAIGIHPTETKELTSKDILWLKEMSSHKKVVAIGEIGLDYYWDEPSREIQKHWFIEQLHLAREVGLPVVIHSRDAAKDTMDIMKAEKAEEIGGVIHCYSYHVDMAKEYVSMGFYLGIGGVVTFNNGKKLKEVVEAIPIEHLVLETDCPYLSPEPLRGKRNDPRNVKYIAQKIADVKGLSLEEAANITYGNVTRIYRM